MLSGERKNKTDDAERGGVELTDAKAEMTDAAQSRQDIKDRQRETRDRREKSDRDQAFQHIQSITGRDFRQR